jgi:hypothetical protein
MKKVLLLLFMSVSALSANASIFDVIQFQQQHNYDLTKTVIFGELNYRILVGEADLKKTQKLITQLNPGLDVQAQADANGKATVLLETFMSEDVIGCGCPTGFTDFIVYVVVQGAKYPVGDTYGSIQIVPTFSMTNQPQRQQSLNRKFGSPMFFGSPGFIGRNGFFVTDFEGHRVLNAKSLEDLPTPTFNSGSPTLDVGIHTVGGDFEVEGPVNDYPPTDRTAKFYRTKANINIGTNAFQKANDEFTVRAYSSDIETDLGAQLGFMKFKPTTWMTRNLSAIAMAWIP